MHLTGFWEFFQNHVEIEVVDVVVVVVAGLVGCNQSPRHRTTNRFVRGEKEKRKISISFFLTPCSG